MGRILGWCCVSNRQDALVCEPRLVLFTIISSEHPTAMCVFCAPNYVPLDVYTAKPEVGPTREIQHNFLML